MPILIVDSSIRIIERLEEIILETENTTVLHRAVSYLEAKKLLKENKYDTLILDIDLPENGSVKLLKEIRKTNEKTCVIILFTQINYYIHKQYKSLGADFFFDKYYDFEKIFELSFINTKEDLGKKESR